MSKKWMFRRPWSMNRFQDAALRSKVYGAGSTIIYPTLKLSGEAGEVAEKVGKVLRDNDGVFTDELKASIASEIGDVLWYCAALAEDLGFNLDDIANNNIKKLKSRQKRGVIHGSGDNR
jgi:NTP pyrophosphatase (non-canonical NTP hydrolase)